MADLYPVVEEKLHAGGLVTLTATGFSMMPLLRHQKDSIILEPLEEPLRINDVVLFRRESGQFVLHRIVGLESNGDYIMRGDNQYTLEHHIARHQVVSRLQAIIRNNRRISCTSTWYKAYVCLLPALRLMRRGLSTGVRYLNAFKHRLRRKAHGNR
jgi:hypothetical protein